MKPDLIADNAIFKPNKMKVRTYNDIIVPFKAFSDIFFSMILCMNLLPSRMGRGNMLNIPMKNDNIQSHNKNMNASGLQWM